MQSTQKQEYDALVSRVRKHYGPSVEIGGYNSHDLLKLQRLAAKADEDQANERASRPLSEAGTRLHHTRERVHRAWRATTDGQATLAKNHRLHIINGVLPELLEPLELPKWEDKQLSTVADYDSANAEAAELATQFETRASKLMSHVSQWEGLSIEEQNRSLIRALADRLDRLEEAR